VKLFHNRKAAGQELAHRLAANPAARNGPLCVVALPRGGVPVACEIAKALHAPLDVLIVRKLGIPWRPELAFGAIASGNVQILNHKMIQDWSISEELVEAIAAHERKELNRRERLYRDNRPPLNVQGCTVILVDDGIATGATMLAAIEALARKKSTRLIIAVPVAPSQTCMMLRSRVDEVISLIEPQWFDAVGSWYIDFPQVSDEEVRALLNEVQTAASYVAQQC
jgi:putative phosphoribosyl transferase